MTFADLKDKAFQELPNAVLTYTDRVLFWGDEKEIRRVLPENKINSIQPYDFDDVAQSVATSTFVKSFFEEAIATALCRDKPLFRRRTRYAYYAVVRDDAAKDDRFSDLRNVLGFSNNPGVIAGNVRGIHGVTWAEAVSIRLEERDGRLWVMLSPDIWIKPLARRKEATDFMRQQRSMRYNRKAYHLLDAWIRILLGSVGSGDAVKVSCFPDTEFSAVFEIGTRTAYSRGGGHGR